MLKARKTVHGLFELGLFCTDQVNMVTIMKHHLQQQHWENYVSEAPSD